MNVARGYVCRPGARGVPETMCVSEAISLPSSFPNVTTMLASTKKIAAWVIHLARVMQLKPPDNYPHVQYTYTLTVPHGFPGLEDTNKR